MINSESSSMLCRSSAAVLLAAAPFLVAACGEQPDPYVMADFNGMTLEEADTTPRHSSPTVTAGPDRAAEPLCTSLGPAALLELAA